MTKGSRGTYIGWDQSVKTAEESLKMATRGTATRELGKRNLWYTEPHEIGRGDLTDLFPRTDCHSNSRSRVHLTASSRNLARVHIPEKPSSFSFSAVSPVHGKEHWKVGEECPTSLRPFIGEHDWQPVNNHLWLDGRRMIGGERKNRIFADFRSDFPPSRGGNRETRISWRVKIAR